MQHGTAHAVFSPEDAGLSGDIAGEVTVMFNTVTTFEAHGFNDGKGEASTEFDARPGVVLDGHHLSWAEMVSRIGARNTFTLMQYAEQHAELDDQ